MMILQESLYHHIIDTLSPFGEIEKILLFGSRARGDAEERSDIDLAIQAPDADLKAWMNILQSIEHLDTLLPIDVIRLEEASAELKIKIETEGKVLYERSQNESKFNESGPCFRPIKRGIKGTGSQQLGDRWNHPKVRIRH